MKENYYQILGIKSNADPDEIKKAYRKKAMLLHPDINPSPDASGQFVQINEAYAILSDPQKRNAYNLKLKRVASVSVSNYKTQVDEEAYQRWVNNARAQAQKHANMSFDEFKQTKYFQVESRVFLYMQFLVIGTFYILGLLGILFPILGMVYVNWKYVFLEAIMVPVAFEVFKIGKQGYKALKQSL